jgi:hypothetical protein
VRSDDRRKAGRKVHQTASNTIEHSTSMHFYRFLIFIIILFWSFNSCIVQTKNTESIESKNVESESISTDLESIQAELSTFDDDEDDGDTIVDNNLIEKKVCRLCLCVFVSMSGF